MLGELLALISAVMGALSAVAMRPALRNISAVSANALRVIVASIFMLPMAIAWGDLQSVYAFPGQFTLLVASVLISFGVGDTLWFRSMKLIGVSLSVSVISTYPLFVIPGATLLLGERPSALNAVGAVAITTGLVMATRVKGVTNNDGRPRGGLRLGLALALGAAVMYSIGVLLVTFGAHGLDPIAANALRLPILALFLAGGSALSRNIQDFRRVTWRIATLLSAAGILGMGLGNVFFIYAIQLAGASRTAPLASTSPVFAALLAAMVLREKVNRWTWGAALLITIGAAMMV